MEDLRLRERLEKAHSAGSRRDYPAAVRILSDLITESEAPVPEAVLLLGRAYHALGEYSRAVAAFRDYLRLCPRSSGGYLFAGRSYLALGMPDQALPLLRRARRLRPDDVQALALLGFACLKTRRSADAVECLQTAVERAPEDGRIYRAYLNALLIRGIKLCRGEDSELGAQMLRFVVGNGLDAPLPHLELARHFRDKGDLGAALDHYERAISLSPGDPSLRWYRASLLMALGRNGEAREELGRIEALGGELPEVAWDEDLVERFMIKSFLEEGAWKRAADACGARLRRRKGDPVVHTMYAEALRNLGDREAARNHLDRAADAGGDQITLRYARILLAWEDGDYQELARSLAAAERLGGDRSLIRRFYALHASRTNGNDRAVVEKLQEAIRDSGPFPELMFALAQRYLKLGLTDLAENWYRKTRQVEPGHEEACLGELAAAEAQAADGDAAAEERLSDCYRNYLRLWPDNRELRREWALLLVKKGLHAEAAGELEILLAWEPENPSLRRVLAYCYRKTARYREAAVLLKRLLRETPKELSLLMEFTGCLERSGAPKFAAEVLRKALPLFKKSSAVHIALGDLLYREKRTEDALDAYREAAAANSADPRPYRRMAAVYRKSGSVEQANRYEKEAAAREKK